MRDVRLGRWEYAHRGVLGQTKAAFSSIDGVDWLTYRVAIKLPGKLNDVTCWFRPIFVLPSGVLVSNAVNWVVTSNVVSVADGIGPEYTSQEYATDPWLGVIEKRDAEVGEAAADPSPVTSPVSSGSVVSTATPTNGFYGVYQNDGSDFMYLYHQLLNRHPGLYVTGNVWVFNRDPSVPGRGVLYQKTVNGNGWLYLPPAGPSWDAATWHYIGFESNGSGGWRLLSEDGKYLFWGDGTVIGPYNGSKASYNLGYTTDKSKALVFTFRPQDAAW